jgi:hypothetical protein
MTAPRRVRSLLRQPRHGPWGRSTTSHGPGRARVRRHTPRPKLHVRLRAPRCGQRQKLVGVRFGRCDLTVLVGDMTKVLVLCGIGAAVLWSGAAPAYADDAPAPPSTTTSEAPPPDPYAPPVRSVKPKPVAPKRTYAPAARTYTAPRRTYTPPASITQQPVVQTSRPHRRAKAVRRHRKQPVRPPAKAPPASAWLAPLPRVLAAARVPLHATGERDHPFLWLAGMAFAALAVGGLSLYRLSTRYFDLVDMRGLQ